MRTVTLHDWYPSIEKDSLGFIIPLRICGRDISDNRHVIIKDLTCVHKYDQHYYLYSKKEQCEIFLPLDKEFKR